MVFCNIVAVSSSAEGTDVTILILIDGFLQFIDYLGYFSDGIGHNPYFNRWFSAI